jgi:DNA repair photolyase
VVRAAREAGLPCGVFLAPVLPWLTDSVEHLDDAVRQVAEAGATGVMVSALHLRPGAREWFFTWLERERPDLVPGYRRLYARGSNASKEYRRWLAERVRPLVRRHGLDGPPTGRSMPEDGNDSWPAGYRPRPQEPMADEQLSLL